MYWNVLTIIVEKLSALIYQKREKSSQINEISLQSLETETKEN